MNTSYRPTTLKMVKGGASTTAVSADAQRARKKRTLLINPRFQLTFLAWSVVMLFASIGTFYGGIYYFFYKFVRLGAIAGLPADHVIFQFLDAQKTQMNTIFIWTAGTASVILVAGSLWISHRVAGPLHRLRQHMDLMAEGQTLDEVKFRKNDFFPELAKSCNRQFELFRKYQKKATRKVI